MKLFRISLLSVYLNYLSTNKKKALRFINLGIFLCIFAISTATISFFVEKEIAKKQTELLYLQIEDKSISRDKSTWEPMIDNLISFQFNEDNVYVDKEYSAQWFEIQQLSTDTDFYAPYIYASLKSLGNFQSEEYMEFFNPSSNEYKEYMNILRKNVLEEDFQALEKKAIKFFESSLPLKEIDISNYKPQETQKLDEIIFEIINHKLNNIYTYDDKLLKDYNSISNFTYALISYFEELLMVFSLRKYQTQNEIQKINSEIISLSNNEKNYILITFIIQFFIFIIIQFFEINSINFNVIKKLRKKNEKTNK